MEAERMKILELVQQGRITAEQANRLLAALEQSYRSEAPPMPPPAREGQRGAGWREMDWGQLGRDLSARISGRVEGALTSLRLGDKISGRVEEALSNLRVGGKKERQSFSRARFTRSSLSRMEDGTVYHNFGGVVIAADVPEELLARKIAQYYNFETTRGPKPLLELLEARGSNFGSFLELDEGQGEDREEEEEEACHRQVARTASPASAAEARSEAVLVSETAEGEWDELAVQCHAGNLDFRGIEDGPFRLVVCRLASSGRAAAAGWENQLPWSQEQQGSQRRFVLGDADNPSATAGLTFRFEIPIEAGITARTEGGSIAARSLSGRLELRTGGGDITCTEIEGDVCAETSGGSLTLSEIEGTVSASTEGGSISCREIEGDATASSGGGDLRFAEIEGSVRARTGGGSIEVSEVEGDVDAETGGGELSFSEIAGSVTAKTGGGDIRGTEVKGDFAVETGGGDIACSEVAGSVKASTGSGSVRMTEVSGDVSVETGSGDIKCNEVAGSVTARTGSGDIKVLEIAGDADLETGVGDITMKDVSGEARAVTQQGRVRR